MSQHTSPITILFRTWNDVPERSEGRVTLTGERVILSLGDNEMATGRKYLGIDGDPRVEWDDCPDGIWLDDAEAAIQRHYRAESPK